jgi:hypothetical protein
MWRMATGLDTADLKHVISRCHETGLIFFGVIIVVLVNPPISHIILKSENQTIFKRRVRKQVQITDVSELQFSRELTTSQLGISL